MPPGAAIPAASSGDRCAEPRYRTDREVVIEARPFTLEPRALAVQAPPNGAVRVEAWDGATTEVTACVKAVARTVAEGRRLVESVRIQTDGTVQALGGDALGRPGSDRGTVTVRFEVRVPRRTDLDLRATNGSIAVSGVEGEIRVRTEAGDVSLADLAGDVRVRTRDGGIAVDLSGDGWRGEGLDVASARSGTVRVSVPAGYSADLSATTPDDSVHLDDVALASLRTQASGAGTSTRSLSGFLGAGGAPIRIASARGRVSLHGRP